MIDNLASLNTTPHCIASVTAYFYSIVGYTGCKWDLKTPESWEALLVDVPFPGNNTVIYAGELFTPEQLGNYTYGWLGHICGYPAEVLIAGSYYAAGFPTEKDKLYNEILLDWPSVMKGYWRCDLLP